MHRKSQLVGMSEGMIKPVDNYVKKRIQKIFLEKERYAYELKKKAEAAKRREKPSGSSSDPPAGSSHSPVAESSDSPGPNTAPDSMPPPPPPTQVVQAAGAT